MPFFDYLPTVEKCCCFSLRTGSIIFAIIGVLAASNLFELLKPCKGEKIYMKCFKFMWAISDLMLFGASVIFLIGLCCYKKRVTATVFLSASAISVIVSILMSIMGTVEVLHKTKCFGWFHVISWYLNIPVKLYSMLVVRSFRDRMEDDT